MTQGSHTLLVLGGARSGKSRYAQARAETLPGELVFVATAQALDDDMADRIARHRADRDARWRTVEAPIEIAEVIDAEAGKDRVVLVDCLTLWASNLMFAERDIETEAKRSKALRKPGFLRRKSRHSHLNADPKVCLGGKDSSSRWTTLTSPPGREAMTQSPQSRHTPP